MLGFVEHELQALPEPVRPVLVSFNPWWFSGQEHLARAFLGQLQAVLPAKYAGFKKLGDKLADFSGAIGGVADLVGAAVGVPVGGAVFEAGARMLGSKPKDVPGLKDAISKLLLEQKKRILVVIDDIDRLTPEEVRQLFTVIKALGDFPYVTYLLAFDRGVAADAIGKQTGLPGERFLEKIIQVPFELPMVDRTTLRQALFSKLDVVMAGTPEGRFDVGHWQNVYFSGLDQLFTVPRDLVRLTNALSVTYPAVVGEVNPFDFIAIECLRVFLPSVYDAIRSSPEEFAGYEAPGDYQKDKALAFHNAWLEKVPADLREGTKDLVERLFPRLESVWSIMHYGPDSLKEWRKALRVCAGGDIFSAYFRLSLPANAISQANINAILAVAGDPAQFGQRLVDAAALKLPTGVSKVRGLLERLLDHIQELTAHSLQVTTALFRVGDELLLPSDTVPGTFDFGNEGRIASVAYRLLKALPPEERLPHLTQAFQGAAAPRCTQYLFGILADEAQKGEAGELQALMTVADTNALKTMWRPLVEQHAQQPGFIDHPDVGAVLSAWRHWGGEPQAKAWAQQAVQTDDGLIKLVTAFSTEVTTHGSGDMGMRVFWRVRPKSLEPFIDLAAVVPRLEARSAAGIEPHKSAVAVKDLLRRWKRLNEGKPDTDDFDDDDDEDA